MTLTIELTILISVLSVSFAIYFGIKSQKRNNKIDIETKTQERVERAKEIQKIHDGIEAIVKAISGIENILQGYGEKIADHGERLMMAENGIKSQAKVIEDIAEKLEKLIEKVGEIEKRQAS